MGLFGNWELGIENWELGIGHRPKRASGIGYLYARVAEVSGIGGKRKKAEFVIIPSSFFLLPSSFFPLPYD
ncbi:MAG TPA: hypothetical protein DCS91_12090 [Microcoleaceae bacterium UBA11344]|nr:hypothetical protein [Microcoleaceae cyanobacterium UBA11344]